MKKSFTSIKLVCLGAKNPETIRIANAVKKHNRNFNLIGFLDNDKTKWGKKFYGYKVLGGIDQVKTLSDQDIVFCNIITGNMEDRYNTSKEIVKRGGKLVNFIYPGINLDMVKIGTGNYIQDNVTIQAGVMIGDNCSIHIGCLISHQCKIGNTVFISFGCNIAGEVTIEDGVFVGAGACIIPRVKIGRWSIIGAEAVVLKDVPSCSVVVGNPGKVIKKAPYCYPNGKVF